ncbi:retrovirus-related pol polyprotein from transposon TNT 1-94 [Tanacetum coccineum]
MVIFTTGNEAIKNWLVQKQTAYVQDQTVLGKDNSNLLIADSLLKTIWFINAPCYGNEALASPKANELTIPEQTATGKGTSNPFMAGYPSTIKNVSAMSVNALYQPWRAILSMINMCLTSKTARFDRPRHPTFLTDRKNLATATRGKKKTDHLLIPSVRFTKLIIHHLRTKHNIHPRTGSPLYYSHEESILNTLGFVRTDGREIFGMLIPDALLTDEIKGAPYYKSSKATKVTKHKAAKATKPAGDKAPKPTATQPPKPKPAPTQPSKAISKKKRKLVKEIPDEPSPAKRSKGGLVMKKRKRKSPLKLVDEPSNEGVPVEEPAYNKEDADLERALELSLMEQGAQIEGPAHPMVIREPESGRIQPLPDVQGKGKEKRRTPTTTEPFGHTESPSLYAKLGLTDSETESDEEVSPEINAGTQDEGQAGPNPGQAGSNPGDAAESQPQSSHVVHAGPNLEHMDFEVTNASTQQNPEQMDEEFTTTAYPSVQENLKLPTEDQVRLEELASSVGTMSSLQNLDKELSFTNQFLMEKSQEDEPDKSNTEAEVQSMVMVLIHQDTSSVPLMTTPVIDLTMSQPVSTTVQAPLPTSTATVTAITTTSLPPPPS